MTSISANELKRRGVSAIEDGIGDRDEAVISVRGRDRYVVLSLPAYNHLRECELEAALAETNRDVAAGRCVVESVDKHIKRISR